MISTAVYSENIRLVRMNESFNSTAASGSSRPGRFIPEPFEMTVVRLTLFAVVFLAAVIGNFFVFTASLRNRRLQTFSYCLITNLAISDFVSMFWVPFLLVNEQLESGWIYGAFLCKFINPTQVVCGLVTTNVHVAIAIDRYFSIVRPLTDSCNHSKYRRALVIVPLIWIVAVICSLPTYIFRELYSLTLKSGKKIEFCYEKFPPIENSEDGYRQMYSVFLFFVNYVIPISISTVLYGKIVLYLKKTKLERKEMGRKFSQSSRNTSSKDVKVYCNNLTKVERRFISMAIIIVTIFFFCYLPYQVVFLFAEFADYATSWPYFRILMSVVYFLTWLPNALNPICYGAMDQRYAKAFKMICLSFQGSSDRGSKNQTGSLSKANRLTEEEL